MKSIIKVLFVTLLVMSPAINAETKLSPKQVAGAVTVDVKAAKDLFDQEVLFIDVRKSKDWQAGRIPGAEHLELKKQFNQSALAGLAKKDEKIVIYCNGPKCLRSSIASADAVKWGFQKIYYFRDGFPAWKKAGYPVE